MLLLITSLLTAALANPACKSVEQNANFDDVPGGLALGTTPPPMPYRGLYFQGFNVVQVVQTNLAPGVLPHSPTHYASVGVQSQTLQGTAMMTTNYQNSNTTSFTLESFYFGNVIGAGQGAAAVPAPVNLHITGYQGLDNQVTNAKQVCSQQFQYNPSTETGVQQQSFSGTINGCKDVQFVIFTFSPQGGMSSLSPDDVLLLDDIKFSAKSC